MHRTVPAIAAVMLTLAAGLIVTAALGLALFGTFNLISVAFAVLFVINFNVTQFDFRHSRLLAALVRYFFKPQLCINQPSLCRKRTTGPKTSALLQLADNCLTENCFSRF